MTHNRRRSLLLGSSILGLLCWVVLFMAGTDIWHAVRPHLPPSQGPSQVDVRAFRYAYYLLAVILAGQVVLLLLDRRSAPLTKER
jgi:hypothetical protein